MLLAGIISCAYLGDSCKNPVSSKSKRHISDSVFWAMNASMIGAPEAENQKRLDSLFDALPYVSVADQYYQLYLKRTIHFLNPNDPAQVRVAITYSDSMMSLIVKNGLYDQMAKEYIRTLEEKANLLTYLKLYEDAIDLIFESRYRNQQLNDMESAVENNFSLALISYYQKKIDSAVSYYKLGLSMVQYYQRSALRFFKTQRAMDDLGFMYRLLGKYDSSLFYHKETVKFILNNKDMLKAGGDTLFAYQALVNVYENIANTYLAMNDPREAKNAALEAIGYSSHLKNSAERTQILANAYPTWATAFLSAGDIRKADSLNQLAGQYYNTLYEGNKLKHLDLQVRIDSLNGDKKKILTSLVRYITMKDSADDNFIEALKKNPTEITEELNRKYEIERKDRDIRIQRTSSITAIAIAIVLGLLGVTLFFYIRKIRQATAELRSTMRLSQIQQKQKEEEHLRYQEMRLVMQHNEDIAKQRREISNDLHDSLSGSLVALRYYIEDIKNRPENKEIQPLLFNISDEVNSIYNSTRQYMHDLNAGVTSLQHDLPEQLEELGMKFRSSELFTVELNIDKAEISQQLTTLQQDQLYYIINEAVSNSIKYAAPSKISISIRFDAGTCIFSITDNGSGFEIGKIKPGLGISSIQSRIEELNGSLKIESGANGTVVSGEFPAG